MRKGIKKRTDFDTKGLCPMCKQHFGTCPHGYGTVINWFEEQWIRALVRDEIDRTERARDL